MQRARVGAADPRAVTLCACAACVRAGILLGSQAEGVAARACEALGVDAAGLEDAVEAALRDAVAQGRGQG